MRWYLVTIATSLTAFAGCSNSSPRVMPPSIDAVAAGRAAISQHDTNGNGQIDGGELGKAGSIKSALPRIDKNNDQQASAEEIAARINEWQATRLGLMGCSIRVTLDGKPLEGATVTFVPEKFLGPYVKPAIGITSPQGQAMLTIDDPDIKARRMSGVQCGLYRVEITSHSGKSIPAKYNTETILGEEVAVGAPCATVVLNYDLKSK